MSMRTTPRWRGPRARRAKWWTGVAVAAAIAGCAHARKVSESGSGDEAGGNAKSGKVEQGSSERVTPKRIPPRGDRPAVAASPEGLMNPGSAREIQEALQRRGYLDQVSGELDDATSAAVRRFQSDQGLAATGVPDRETLRSLGIDPSDVYQTGTGSRGGDKP